MAKIKWKTQKEIEAEKNAPRPLTDIEILGINQSEREIQEIILGRQLSDMEIRLLMGGL
ncbi:hypothetical protein [Ornithinibacillus bavariensis]|uniref:Uncharacterized protein n=1 Tax=Ornithinibacillus bavariensis TaxID=545502 RepID=A0A919X9V6_9BACI|nr:hypothetical protein [Ornithinibacillus bavariensis]GIO27719.1 hypothetical protein J43TS3_23300 [Ornithinibacillus bavariensis]